ncbi:glycosyltransferase [Caproicibacterium sp. NSD3]
MGEKMKRLMFYIGSMQMGGANRVMANLTKYFVNKDVKVTLINDVIPCNKKEYAVDRKVHRVYLQNNIKNKLLKNIIMMFKLRKLIWEDNPDAVISFMGPPNYRLLLSTIGMKTKKIVSVRNDPYKEYGNGIKKYVSRIVFSLSDGCIFQTNDAAMYFSDKLRERSKIIFNPVATKFYNQERKLENKEIAVVGRLVAQKNPELALRAFALICNKYPEYTLSFYGEGELKNHLYHLANELKVQDKVFLRGTVNDIEIRLSSVAVYILSSDYEGMPNALMEAMAVGIPIIATDCPCGGPRILLENKNQGLLVPCNNVKSMSLALEKILSDDLLRTTMRSESRKRAEQFYPDKVYRQWESYIDELLQ